MDDDECVEQSANWVAGETEALTRSEPAPVPQGPPDLTRAQTPAAAVESQRLTA
jgi:hypothetical protein